MGSSTLTPRTRFLLSFTRVFTRFGTFLEDAIQKLWVAVADLEALLDEDDWDIREPGESLEDLCRYLCWDPNEGARKDLFKTAFLHLEESCNEILEEVYMQGWHTKFVNSWRSRHTSRKWNWVDLDDAAGELLVLFREVLPGFKGTGEGSLKGSLEGYLRRCSKRYLTEWCGRSISPVSLSRDEARKGRWLRGFDPRVEIEEDEDGYWKPTDLN